jgi:hypothetical protein
MALLSLERTFNWSDLCGKGWGMHRLSRHGPFVFEIGLIRVQHGACPCGAIAMYAAKIGIAVALSISCSAALARAGSNPQFPFLQHFHCSAGSILPNHRSQAQLDQDVRDAYADSKASFLLQAGTQGDRHPHYRVRVGPLAGDRTVSEGQGYGMLIVGLMSGHACECANANANANAVRWHVGVLQRSLQRH